MNAGPGALWRRARDSLAAAGALISIDPDSAASRAYYAAFYAVSALFAAEKRRFRRHTALQAAVHRDLVRAGRWGASLGEDFNSLVSCRLTGDYGGDERVSAADMHQALHAAERILEAVRSALPVEAVQP